MENYKIEVYCTTQIEGTHNWPDCPHEEVLYLRDEHRHMFYIKAHIQVNHSNRDIEFIILKHNIEQYLTTKYTKPNDIKKIHRFGSMSCEMIAIELIEKFKLSKCEISEDNENGAVVSVIPQP